MKKRTIYIILAIIIAISALASFGAGASALVKNHYQVKMGKQFKKGSQKSYDYYLEIVDTLDRKEEVQKNECAGKA